MGTRLYLLCTLDAVFDAILVWPAPPAFNFCLLVALLDSTHKLS